MLMLFNNWRCSFFQARREHAAAHRSSRYQLRCVPPPHVLHDTLESDAMSCVWCCHVLRHTYDNALERQSHLQNTTAVRSEPNFRHHFAGGRAPCSIPADHIFFYEESTRTARVPNIVQRVMQLIGRKNWIIRTGRFLVITRQTELGWRWSDSQPCVKHTHI